jgi:hypothetical protein
MVGFNPLAGDSSRQRWEHAMESPLYRPLDSWREQEARNEAGARERNEWIRGENQRFAGVGKLHTFVCECGDGSCEAPIELTFDQYEAVRVYATRFAIAPNHENPEAEYVVREGAAFAVVEKIDEPYRRIVRETDPRRETRRPPP